MFPISSLVIPVATTDHITWMFYLNSTFLALLTHEWNSGYVNYASLSSTLFWFDLIRDKEISFVLSNKIIYNYYCIFLTFNGGERGTVLPAPCCIHRTQCKLTGYTFPTRSPPVNLQVFLLALALLLVPVILEVPKTENDDYACKNLYFLIEFFKSVLDKRKLENRNTTLHSVQLKTIENKAMCI